MESDEQARATPAIAPAAAAAAAPAVAGGDSGAAGGASDAAVNEVRLVFFVCLLGPTHGDQKHDACNITEHQSYHTKCAQRYEYTHAPRV